MGLQSFGEVGRDLGLLAAREAHADDVVERGVGRLARGGQELELVRVLDRPQHRQGVARRDVVGIGQDALKAEQVHRPGRVRDRVAALGIEQLGRRLVRVVAVGPV